MLAVNVKGTNPKRTRVDYAILPPPPARCFATGPTYSLDDRAWQRNLFKARIYTQTDIIFVRGRRLPGKDGGDDPTLMRAFGRAALILNNLPGGTYVPDAVKGNILPLKKAGFRVRTQSHRFYWKDLELLRHGLPAMPTPRMLKFKRGLRKVLPERFHKPWMWKR